MATLSETISALREANGKKAPQPAGRVVTLKPEAYREECEGKPASHVVVGLRTPSEDDYRAARKAETDDDVVLAIVSVGICDPNDCTRAHPSFPFPDIQVKSHLKPATVRYLFDEIERLHIETSPIVPLATDEELFLLGDALQSGELLEAIEAEQPAKAARIRRLATALLESLGVEV